MRPRSHQLSPELVLLFVALLAVVSATEAHAAEYKTTGRWHFVPDTTWNVTDVSGNLVSGGGTHMALLRGAGQESWVLHFSESDLARMWQVLPMDTIGVARRVPYYGANAFCGGHAQMADGKLLVVGGTVENATGILTGATGENRNVTFDPTQWSSSSRGWTPVDSMHLGRWYPTVTTLGDGRLLTTAGAQWLNMIMFGGIRDSGATSTHLNDVRFLNLRPHENWAKDPTDAQPPRRQGHSSVFVDGFTVIFGGESDDIRKRDAWALYGENTNRGRRYRWNELRLYADPTITGMDSFPAPRSGHVAVAFEDTMFVFGGKDASGNALADLWRLRLDLGADRGFWEKLNVASGPSARFGHAAAMIKSDRTVPIMVVYGGENSAGLIDSTCWGLTIARPVPGGAGTFRWNRGPQNTLAGKRSGHTIVPLSVGKNNARTHRLAVFGGTRQTGALGNDVHEIRLAEVNPPDSALHWRGVAPTFLGTLPAARTRHAAAYDGEFHRMIVFGGDVTTTAGGYSNDLWELSWRLNSAGTETDTAIWQPVVADSIPGGRWGHTITFDTRPVEAHIPEVFTAAGECDTFPGPKYLPFYPFVFQLRDGNVFFAGNGPEHVEKDSSWLYLNAGTSQARWDHPKRSNPTGGAPSGWLGSLLPRSGSRDEVWWGR